MLNRAVPQPAARSGSEYISGRSPSGPSTTFSDAMSLPISRRKSITILVRSVLLVAELPMLPARANTNPMAKRLRGLFDIDRQLVDLVRPYVIERRKALDTEALIVRVLGDAVPMAKALDDEQLRQAVRDRISDDAFRGRLVVLNGWGFARAFVDLITLSIAE